MKITKSRLKALDQPSERCDSSTGDPNTSQCIARYIEDEVGCSLKIQGGMSRRGIPPCKLLSELEALKNITRQMREADANTIFELTGSLASCERNEYANINGRFIETWCKPPYDLHLEFKIIKGSHKEEEQYIIYDFNSFIGESGGIMGLCLGYSVLSLYEELVHLLRSLKPSKLMK